MGERFNCRPATARLAAILGVVIQAGPAQAHAFGARYDLPLPLEFYLAGAAAAVALSFVVMALFFRAPPGNTDRPSLDQHGSLPIRIHPIAVYVLQIASVGLFLLVIAAGFFGTQEPSANIGPTFIWIIWWVGLAYLVALVGDLWPAINPWSIIYSWIERLAALARPGSRPRRHLHYPSWLGAWPAAFLFGVFAWFELVDETAQIPRTLAIAILFYSGVTWAGMAAFGRTVWLANGEAFSLFFKTFGRFAPVGGLPDHPDSRRQRWYLRPYASALIVDEPCKLSMTAFVIVMLATVTFDGFKETPLWGDLLQWIASAPVFNPGIRVLHDLGFNVQVAIETAVLAGFPLMFLLVYLGFSWLTKLASGDRRPVIEIAGLFVFSLVPIAIAYHLAHYLSYLLIGGQFLIPLASDPFGAGWNLFGTVGYRANIGIIDAKFVWYTSVFAIVIGHVVAVGVAHSVSIRVMASVGNAIRSQFPMLILMVAYTTASLWILAQPIVGGPELTFLQKRSGTVSLVPLQYREYCLDLTAQDSLEYAFEADGPVDFDIHYHDGLTVVFPVELTGTTGHTGQFSPNESQSYCLMWSNRGLSRASMEYRIGRALY